MKINKKQIIVSALALVIGASLAGSVSGTIAWYQYSTRVSAGFIGSAVGVSENLQIRFEGEDNDAWRTRLTWQEVNAKLAEDHYAEKLMPISAGAMDKDDALGEFKANPVYGIADFDNWIDASEKNYAKINLELRFLKTEGGEQQDVEKDVYLSDLVIQKNANASTDLSDAVRVHFSTADRDMLVSKNGGSIDTHGALDLDGKDGNDKVYGEDKYNFEGADLEDIDYGDDGEQVAYAIDDVVVEDDGSIGLVNTDDKAVGKIEAGQVLDVEINIWLEGWQKIDGKAVWDADFEEKAQFNVGFEFAVEGDQL